MLPSSFTSTEATLRGPCDGVPVVATHLDRAALARTVEAFVKPICWTALARPRDVAPRNHHAEGLRVNLDGAGLTATQLTAREEGGAATFDGEVRVPHPHLTVVDPQPLATPHVGDALGLDTI